MAEGLEVEKEIELSAVRMLERGLDVKRVAEITGMSEESIIKLKIARGI